MGERGEVAARFEHRRQIRPLDDRHLRAGVADQVLDLGRRIGQVDRERGGAEHRRREVDDVEPRAVAEHDRHGVAVADAQLGQPTRDALHAPQQLRPRQRDAVIGGADRDDVRVVDRRAP
jgi:hypothetical protein